MRIKVHCQNRVGILRDILNLLVDYGINVNRGEVGGDQGNAIYLLCPNMINLQLQSLRPKLEAVPGVFGVKRVGLMPSERRHLELNALLAALDFPVLSVDMGGQIVAVPPRSCSACASTRCRGFRCRAMWRTSTCPNWCAPTRRGSTGCG